MPAERELFLTARHVPKSEIFLGIVGRSECLAIGTERDGIETVAIPLDGASVLTANHVPEFDCLVVAFPPTGRGEGFIVGTERHRRNSVAIPVECSDCFAAGCLPDFN